MQIVNKSTAEITEEMQEATENAVRDLELGYGLRVFRVYVNHKESDHKKILSVAFVFDFKSGENVEAKTQ